MVARASPRPGRGRERGAGAGAGTLLKHGSLKARAWNRQEANRFKWVIKDQKYFRRRCTPGGGPPFGVEAGERWLDVGANVGYFALLALDNGAASVTCVEAERQNLQRLRSNLALNGHGPATARVLRALVRDRAGRPSKLLLSRKSTRHSVLAVPEAEHGGEAQEVPSVATLRQLLADPGGPYDAVKLNIEGAEREVLLAMGQHSWGKSVRKMVVEYSFDVLPVRRDYEHLLRHLKETGWQVFPESVPAWYAGAAATWDRRQTRGNDARQIWAFRKS